MSFKEKYIAVDEWDKLKAEDQVLEKRAVIGNDAYAIGETIDLLADNLIQKIEKVRLSLMK